MDTSSHGEEAPPPHPTEAAVQAADGGDGTAALRRERRSGARARRDVTCEPQLLRLERPPALGGCNGTGGGARGGDMRLSVGHLATHVSTYIHIHSFIHSFN